MAFRRFKDIFYPIPSWDTVMERLYPEVKYVVANSVFTKWDDPKNRTPLPNIHHKVIKDDLARIQKISDYYEYERKRSTAYADVAMQLDMLYHDIKNGNIENGTWMASIDSVKRTFPKPKGPAPDLNPPEIDKNGSEIIEKVGFFKRIFMGQKTSNDITDGTHSA